MVASAGDHLGDPGKKFVLPVVLYHSVQLAYIFEVLAHPIQRFSQVFRVLFKLLGTFDDLLVQDLIAVNEIAHISTEHRAAFGHLHRDRTSACDQVGQIPTVFNV